METEVYDRIVPDTSVIIEGLLSDRLSHGSIKANEILIHEAVVAELEHQANEGKAIGFLGLDELKRIKEVSVKNNFNVFFKGIRPRPIEIRHASLGEIDAMIRQLAYDEDAMLITSDKVQSEVALAKGMKVVYYKKPDKGLRKLKLERFFDETTMSVHLRENVPPFAKKGRPGSWEFKELRKALLKQEEIQDISREIIEDAKLRKDGFIEIERVGSTIVQLGNFRIVITRPPFSDGWEITAVRPVKKLSLADYKLSDKLMNRVAVQAEGVLVAGSPGMGKTTFVQALAEFYADQNKVVKTVEAPRDLVLPEKITQYAISLGTSQEIHDILLLSRPDYTIFDEMRNTDDFKLFADLRLAGVGMVGVVHATSPVDAIQRFLGRIEMGVIPQVVDTVIFIKNGEINKVLALRMTVKVPSGMTEADPARPVVEILDFETDRPAYEIYSYGEQTVVVPVQKEREKTGMHRLAESSILSEFQKYSRNAQVEVVSDNKVRVYVPEGEIAKIIGKAGSNIIGLEKKLGVGIDVESLDDYKSAEKSNSNYSGPDDEVYESHKGNAKSIEEHGEEVKYSMYQKKNNILIELGQEMQNSDVNIYINDEFLLTAKTSKMGVIKIKKNNNIGQRLIEAMHNKENVKLLA